MLIAIPFSPKYMAKAAQYYWPKGNHEAQFTMTDALAAAVLDSEGAKLDHQRTFFDLPYQSDIASGMKALKEASAEARLDKSIFPANLTEKEVRRIYAVAMTNGVDHLQGGLLQMSTHSLVPWFAYFSQGGLFWETPLITLENKNITFTHRLRATEMMGRKAEPLVVANYSTEIIDKGDAFIARAKNKYVFAIDVNFWREEILPRVHARLDDEKPLSSLDLFALIPCLGSHDVMKHFAKRIVKEDAGCIAISQELIAVCFAEKPKVAKRIMSEINLQFSLKEKLEADKKTASYLENEALKKAETLARNLRLGLEVALGVLMIGVIVGLAFTGVGAVPFIFATLACLAVFYTRLAIVWNKSLKEAASIGTTASVISELEGGHKRRNSIELKKTPDQKELSVKKDKAKADLAPVEVEKSVKPSRRR